MILKHLQWTYIFHRTAVKQLCDTMKNQILSRAFYGCKYCSWLQHLFVGKFYLSAKIKMLKLSYKNIYEMLAVKC